MGDFSIIIKKSLLVCIFGVLFLPLIQSVFTLVVPRPLKGDISLPENIELTSNTWITGDYQEKKEELVKYLDEVKVFMDEPPLFRSMVIEGSEFVNKGLIQWLLLF